ncbi:hypothetical protein IMZ48_00390 [Candidatus Bathyarchaeota archaeon]|nr:hypothetical protein [Candidatus Bathyarchaeota archaeon]
MQASLTSCLDICKYFGESTTDGIQFQFRSIKKDAQSLRGAVDNGEDPTAALSFTAGTPSSKRSPAKSTPGTGRSTATVKSTGGRKRKAPVKLEASEDDAASEEVDYKTRDPTPTPAPRPAKRAKATAAKNYAVDLTSESEDSAATPVGTSMTSSFLMDDSKPAVTQSQSQSQPQTQAQAQSFYENSYAPSFGMNDSMMNQDPLESFYPVGEI